MEGLAVLILAIVTAVLTTSISTRAERKDWCKSLELRLEYDKCMEHGITWKDSHGKDRSSTNR